MPQQPIRVEVPTYPFDRRRHWVDGDHERSQAETVQRSDLSLVGRRLAAADDSERDSVVLEHVRDQVASIIGATGEVDPERTFAELGMDSASAVDLRAQLEQAVGMRLPSSLAFDYPTPAAVALHLRSRLEGVDDSSGNPGRVVSDS